eukprot:2723244-Rhodomonas_salina.3
MCVVKPNTPRWKEGYGAHEGCCRNQREELFFAVDEVAVSDCGSSGSCRLVGTEHGSLGLCPSVLIEHDRVFAATCQKGTGRHPWQAGQPLSGGRYHRQTLSPRKEIFAWIENSAGGFACFELPPFDPQTSDACSAAHTHAHTHLPRAPEGVHK